VVVIAMAAPSRPPFFAWLEEHMGLDLANAPHDGWERALAHRMRTTGSASFEVYRQRVSGPERLRSELEHFAGHVTVGETYFFRESSQLDALARAALPALVARRAGDEPIRILSVGCSTGEEPYSIAITTSQLVEPPGARIEITAVDANPAAIDRARRGCYSEWALRATLPHLRDQFFRKTPLGYLLSDQIKDRVRFVVGNIFDDSLFALGASSFDVVFCRNVLIYFSRRKIAHALERFSTLLRPDGFLFLGHSETTRGYSRSFTAVELHGAFCYRPAHASARPSKAAPKAAFAAAAPTVSAAQSRDSWIRIIDQSTHRLQRLGESQVAAPDATPVARRHPRRGADARAEALDLMRAERFVDALATLDQIASPEAYFRETVLTRVAILLHLGRIGEAMQICERLIDDFPACAGAHHLLAVAAEHEGDTDRALDHHRQAIGIDPGFAMSRLRCGLLARRASRFAEARTHLGAALEALSTASSDDLLLFAGGFSGDALIELCRAELRACEVER
jgi:chemotaxis protein methyltransferase CheR